MIRRVFFLVCLLLISGVASASGGVAKTAGWTGQGAGPAGYFSPDAACDANYAYDVAHKLVGGGGGTVYPASCTATSCTCTYKAVNGYTYNATTGTSKVMACPASASYFNDGDQLCYPAAPSRCPDGTFTTNISTCPAPPQCALGYVDGGLDGRGVRICTAKVCPPPSVLNLDGLCGAPPGDPTAPITPSNKGETGATGAQGVKGDKGDKGDTGAAGAAGVAGADGAQGAQGSKGDKGDTGIGMTGATGAQGLAGANGAQGLQGLQGLMGLTGMAGSTGAAGVAGAQGAQGIQGVQGVAGAVGATGLTGATGLMGLMGLTGAAGVAGAAGTDGVDGKSFCEANPGLAACRDSSVSGACAATTCDGDAIQCATLRAAAAIQCTQEQDARDLKSSSAYAAGVAAMNGAVDPDAPTKVNGETVGVDRLDSSGWLGGGSFFKDKVIALPDGQSLTIPFSQAENIFLVFRAVAMSIAALISMKIMRESISGV